MPARRKITAITDLHLDLKNANRGTERGAEMIEQSLRSYGAGRSILTDKNGVVIAGNKTLTEAVEIGLPIQAVHTTGQTLVVVVRDDLDLSTDETAQALAIADNRASEVGLNWDPRMLEGLRDDSDVDLSDFWTDAEIRLILSGPPADDEWSSAISALPSGDKSVFQQMTFTITDHQADIVNRAIARSKSIAPFGDTGNANSNGNALARICEAYLNHG